MEFALVAPLMMLVLLGLCDIAQTLYMIASLQGVVQKVARDSTLEDYSTPAAQAALDANVQAQIRALVSDATVPTPTRRFYDSYSDAAARSPESWTDTNHDQVCDNGETFTDTNGNGVWDADGGGGGGGGADDKTIYTVKVSYRRLFPIYRFIGLSSTTSLSASTVLQNQPYAQQNSYTPTTATCP